MRRLPSNPPPPFQPAAPGMIEDSFDISLITPMIGGGVRSWHVEREEPFRAAPIKSQLRFWWRTFQNAASHEELRDREHRLWGGAGSGASRQASLVSLSISSVQCRKEDFQDLREGESSAQYPKYVFFPLESQPGRVLREASFRLSVSLRGTAREENWPQVVTALRLWILFGGVGARTRRGCGSLYSEKLMAAFANDLSVKSLVVALGESAATHGASASLAGARLVMSAPADGEASDVWKELVQHYMAFRQGPGIGRKAPYGRSYWPEPDSIRQALPRERWSHKIAHPSTGWFPRAAFGLPIQFKFKETGDNKYNLKPGDRDRWPSPVILKAVRFDDGKVSKLCLALKQQFPRELQIEQTPLPPDSLPANCEGREMRTDGKHPTPRGTEPVDGLLEYLKHCGLNRLL